MLRVEEAQALVWQYASPHRAVSTPIDAALNRVLAEDIVSPADLPPYDKSLVDGFAVLAPEECSFGELTVRETVAAGQVPVCRVVSGTAVRIMTGAPIPEGANAVVMLEQTELLGENADRIVVRQSPVKSGQNIMRRGEVLKQGTRLLNAGRRIRPIEIGLLAEMGHATVPVFPAPAVSVLATGNELIAAGNFAGPGQIYNSNGPMLCNLVRQAHGVARDLGIAPDNAADLQRLIRAGLNSNVLILSGGVSAGLFDLVPHVLVELGVQQVFHKVNLKPGKPLWFGVLPSEEGSKLVFGLPGNPVSTLVCFQLFVRPALARLAGDVEAGPVRCSAILAAEHMHDSDRTTFLPATRVLRDGEAYVQPVNWKGSSDLASLAHANCLLHLPAGRRRYLAGERVEVFDLD